MGGKKRKGLLERTASAFALPADVVAGAGCVQIIGREEAYVQNHKGILSYGEDEITVSAGKTMVHLRGSELKLRSMTATDLVVTGLITAVELE